MLKYTSFWERVIAFFIDLFLFVFLVFMIAPDSYLFDSASYMRYLEEASSVYGGARQSDFRYIHAIPNQKNQFLIFTALPTFLILTCWMLFQATPGKFLIGARIVDEKTGKKPTTFQFLIRYLGYFISSFFFGLGYLWAAFDSKKQTWHDKLSKTLVVSRQTKQINFDQND